MNASNTSGMINALQNLDGTPYNPPEEVSSTFPKRNWTQTVTTTPDVTQCSTYYSAAPSNSPVPPSTPSHQSQQPSSSQCDPLEAKAQEFKAAWESDAQKAYRQKALSFENYGLTTDPQGYLVLLYSNSINTIEKPFSACRNLRAQKIATVSKKEVKNIRLFLHRLGLTQLSGTYMHYSMERTLRCLCQIHRLGIRCMESRR